MKTKEAIEEVLKEDSRMKENSYSWMFMLKVLRKLGFNAYIQFEKKLPSPETLLAERRQLVNKKNMFASNFEPEEGVSYEPRR